jgi:hypothetical protein
MFSFDKRKFSINRNTGCPKPGRRFSIGQPSENGESLHPLLDRTVLTFVDKLQRRAVRFIANFELRTKGTIAKSLQAMHSC